MSATQEADQARIKALVERVNILSEAAEKSERRHAAELDTMHDAAIAWRDHARKLEVAMEAIEILYRCHNPRDSGHAMDVVKHIANSAGSLPQPQPVPDHGIPF